MIIENLSTKYRKAECSIYFLVAFFSFSALSIGLKPLPAQAQGVILTIDANVQYQTIDGFGGHYDNAARRHKVSDDEYNNSDLWDMITNDLGLTIIRMNFPCGIEEELVKGHGDNDDPFVVNHDAFDPWRDYFAPDGSRLDSPDIKGLQKLREHGIKKIFLTSWAYPAWLNNGWPWGGSGVTDPNEWAELVVETIRIFREELDIPITHVSPYNEPNIFWNASGSHVSQLVNTLRPRLDTAFGAGTVKIVAAENSGVEVKDSNGNLWVNESAWDNLDVYAFHNYTELWGAPTTFGWDVISNFQQQSGVPSVWQTEASNYCACDRECSEDEVGGDCVWRADSYDEGLMLGGQISVALTAGNVTAWFWWLINGWANDARGEGQRLIQVDRGINSPTPSPKYYAFKQFSRYIKPGSKRIDVQGGNWELFTSAYLHTYDGTFTIIAVNLGGQKEVTFNLNSLTVNSLNRYRYSEGEKCEDIGDISIFGSSFTDELIGRSITTYTTQSSSLFTDNTPPSTPTGVSAQVVSESQINLSWNASSDTESGIREYKVFRDGTQIATTSTTSYSDRELSESTTYTYTVVAVNGAGLESGHSHPVQATTLSDSRPPTIAQVSLSSSTQLNVVFSEPVEKASAEDVSNYSIDNGIKVTGAKLNTDLVTVYLMTTAHTLGLSYTIRISNVLDRALVPNVIATNISMTYMFSIYERRVNSGGGVYTDGSGKDWAGDQAYSSGGWGYVGGQALDRPGLEIANTTDDVLYQSERWGLTAYEFDLPNGRYQIRLHLAEVWEGAQSPGQRIFDVWIEGERVLDSFDIYAEVGYQTATVREFAVEVTEGQLNIDFSAKINFPKISAIEILGVGGRILADTTPPAPPKGVRIR